MGGGGGKRGCKRGTWYRSFMQHTQNNFDTNTEMTMKTDIYYKELIMASNIISKNQQT